MSKVLLVGPKEGLGAFTDLLHNLHRAHIVKTKKLPEGFEHGRPLAAGTEASAQLVQLRAVKATLPIQPVYDGPLLKTSEVKTLIEGTLKDAEQKLLRKMTEREELQRKFETVNDTLEALKTFRALKLNLDLYRPYQSLQVMTGSAAKDPEAELAAAGFGYELFRGDVVQPQALALFVATNDGAKASEILARAGFREERIPAPTAGLTDYALDTHGQYSGPVDLLANDLHNKSATLNANLQAIDREIEKLRAEWSHSCLPAEEHLQIAVEKSELPFEVLVTGHAYMAEFWLPDSEVGEVKGQFEKALGDAFHFEVVQQGMGDHAHGHDQGEAHAAHGHEASGHGAEAGHEAEAAGGHGHGTEVENVPVKLANPPYVNAFEMLTKLFSTPQYDELDPTAFLSLFYPVFFGLMVGDLGYGILIALLGILALKAGKKGSDIASLGVILIAAGTVAAVTGYFIFGDLFGIAFYGSHGEKGWHEIVGVNWPGVGHESLIHKLSGAGVNAFLTLSLVFGVVHMFLGFALGSLNEVTHSLKHGLAKIAWAGVLLFLGMLILDQPMCRSTGPGEFFWKCLSFMQDSPGHLNMKLWLGLGIVSSVVLIITEPVGLVEILAPLANTISYTRLAGIGIAKAALVGAMNAMILPLWDLGIGGKIGCIVLILLAHVMVLGLGILSGGVQALRLNFFEFCSKFMKGGGTPYVPFGRQRQYTVTE